MGVITLANYEHTRVIVGLVMAKYVKPNECNESLAYNFNNLPHGGTRSNIIKTKINGIPLAFEITNSLLGGSS
jgi:hypothetical protein